MKRLLAALAFVVLLAPVGSCVIVAHEHCREGTVRCDGDLIEECSNGGWDVVQDCWYLCGGYCDFDRWGRVMCVC